MALRTVAEAALPPGTLADAVSALPGPWANVIVTGWRAPLRSPATLVARSRMSPGLAVTEVPKRSLGAPELVAALDVGDGSARACSLRV